MRLEGKVAIVTGAAAGFGEAIASRFADEGASVMLADIDTARGSDVAAALTDAGATVDFVGTDVSSSSDVKGMIDACVARFGGLDIIANNAGFSHRTRPITEIPEEDFDRVFAVNTKSVYLSAVHGVPALRERGGGVIVNTASIASKRPRPFGTVYAATKGAVATLTRGLAAELAADRIRVCAVNPVAADTDFMTSSLGQHPLPDDVKQGLVAGIPLGRLATPVDVANAFLFLASDEAEFLTGVCLDVDGGRSLI